MANQKTPAPNTARYAASHKSKKTKRGHGRWVAALIVILLLLGGYFVLQEFFIFTPDGIRLALGQEYEESQAADAAPTPTLQISADAGPRISIDAGELPPDGAGHLNGIWLEVRGLGEAEIRAAVTAAQTAGYTAIVVPVKATNSTRISAEELAAVKTSCEETGLRLAAYISCFRDDTGARADQTLALCDENGNLFIDYSYSAWLNPYLEAVRALILDHCRFAISGGADELILDHLCFPHEGNIDTIVYPETALTPREVIGSFTEELRAVGTVRIGAVLYGDDTIGEGASESKGQDLALFLTHFERIWAYAADLGEAWDLYAQTSALSPDAQHAFAAIIGDTYQTSGVLFP